MTEFRMTDDEMRELDYFFTCLDVADRIERALKHSTKKRGEMIFALRAGMLRSEWQAVARACRQYAEKK